MRNINLEEGEAYFLQDVDDDENIDPDKDFSYIDKKIENFLGHYQKDFMGGLSAESLGARFGGYGSFLPMQQRSAPILYNQSNQSYISSKSPQNLPSELSHLNPTSAANHSLLVKSGPGTSDNSLPALSESGISSVNNQFKLQGQVECASNNQPKNLMIHHSEKKSLKFRVKMTAENVLSCDNSAIYSGLGLDISPSSSLEDSPSDYDGTPPGMQEMKPESPSCIIKIMTTFPLPNDEVMSPLHDRLVCLMGKNSLETAVPGCAQAPLVNNINGNTWLEGKRDASNDKKFKVKDQSKVRKSKQKEPSKERKLKKKAQSVKPIELVKENHEYISNTVAASANRMEGSGALSGVDACPKEMELAPMIGKGTGFKSSIMFDKKSEVGCSEEETSKSMQQVEDANTLKGRTEMDKSVNSIMRRESSTDKKNEFSYREDDASKFLKQQNVTNDKVKEGFFNPICFKQSIVCRNQNEIGEKISRDKEVGFVSLKGVEENDKHAEIDEKMKDLNVQTLEPSKQKMYLKTIPHPQMVAGVPSGKEHPSSMAKKKLKESQSDGMYTAEPPKGSLMVGFSTPENVVVVKHNSPSKSRKVEMDSKREMRKDSDVASNVYPSKKGKYVGLKDIPMGVLERETHAFSSKQKEKSITKKKGVASNVRSSIEGDLAGCNRVTEKLPVFYMLPAEIVPLDNWVQCDKCQKWRLLPLGMDPESLPKEWICSMLTWLPGMNNCSVSEDETNDALCAQYQPLVPTSQLQNYQQAYPDGGAFVGASAGAKHVGLSSQATNFDAISAGGKRSNLVNTETDAARRGGFQEHIPVKKDQQCSSEIRNSRNQKKLPRESMPVRKSGDGKPSKFEKKRVADCEVSGVPKKMKGMHLQSVDNPDLVGLSTAKAKGENQNNDPVALRIIQDFVKRSSKSPIMKVKDRTQNAKSAKDSEMKDIYGKKRKLKDRRESIISTDERSGKTQHPMKNWVSGKNSDTEPKEEKKVKKLKTSNFEGKEFNTDKGNGRTPIDTSRPKRGTTEHLLLVEHYTDRASKKTADTGKSSERAFDLGLSDNATSSSSSKVSCKFKAKSCEVKCSPVGSISSSPSRVYKSDPAKHINKMSNAAFDDRSGRKTSAGKCPGAHIKETLTNLGGRKIQEGGALTSKQNFVSGNHIAKSSNRLLFCENNSEGEKSNDPPFDSEKEPHEKGNGSNAMNVDNVNLKLFREVVNDHSSLRHPNPTGHMFEDIEASPSTKKDSSQRAAKSALREATNLRHSANHLKNSGSGLESNEVFFQAALKFLHGASLLELDNSGIGRYGEMTSTEAYSTTATLCKNCAREYERSNNLAAAALAYKCMEVAYMRVVYCNDLAASRDWRELQTAVRAAPQVESPSSSASDIDNLNNQAATDTVKDGQFRVDRRTHVISAGNRPNFVRLLNFTEHANCAMEASRRSQCAFTAANSILADAGNDKGISAVKSVLDFSFHDVDGLLHLVLLAMEALIN